MFCSFQHTLESLVGHLNQHLQKRSETFCSVLDTAWMPTRQNEKLTYVSYAWQKLLAIKLRCYLK